jgi:anti-sigma regulatory factor (Ser/Thr protein kinase)
MLTGTAIRARSTIPGCVRSVPRTRAFVDAVLGPDHPGRETARLLASELVTNAVLHSASSRPGGSITVTIMDVPGGIRVEVADEGSEFSVPVVRDDPLALDGRGLLLVQTLADDWGYRRDPAGTTVWFQVAVLEPLWPPWPG